MASRVTRNILGALASGANAALLKNMALREDQQQYNLGRQRWRGEEAERRKLELGYGEEDYGIKRKREVGEYGVKRSRALDEHKENLAFKDAERERMIGAGALIGKEINDPRYAQQTIAKVWGLPDIPDLEARQLERGLKQSQIDYYNTRGEKALQSGSSKTSGSGALKSGKGSNPYSDMTHVTNALMKYEDMLASDGRIDPVTGKEIKLDSDTKLWLAAQIKALREHQDLLTKLNPDNAQSVATGYPVSQAWDKFNQIIRLINQGAQSAPVAGSTQTVPAPETPAGSKALANPVAPEKDRFRRADGGVTFAPYIDDAEAWLRNLWEEHERGRVGRQMQQLVSGTPSDFIRDNSRQYLR
jgi:hypothetical protein